MTDEKNKDERKSMFQEERQSFWEVVIHISAHGYNDDDRDVYMDPGVLDVLAQED